MFEPKVKNRQTDMLMNAIIRLHDLEDAYRFFEDLCTIPEIRSISQRLEVAELLRKKETYQKIAEETGASSATISRVRRNILDNEAGGMMRDVILRKGFASPKEE